MHPQSLLRSLAVGLLAAVSGSLSTVHAAPAGDPGEVRQIVQDVAALQIDRAHVVRLQSTGIQRDVGTFQLTGGYLFFCNPVAGRIVAAVFVGSGTFRMKPSTPIERAQLKRFYGAEDISEPFESAVFVFTDRTVLEIERKGEALAPDAVPSEQWDQAGDALDEMKAQIYDSDLKSVDQGLMRALLQRDTNELFVARFDGAERGPLYWEVNPYDPEEITFGRKVRIPGGESRETLCAFHQQDEYLGELDEEGVARQVSISAYDIDLTIHRDLEVHARADMTLRQVSPRLRWFALDAAPEIVVDSARWGDGTIVPVVTQPGTGVTWVRSPDSGIADASHLIVSYHGKFIERVLDWVIMLRTNDWYPRHDFADRARFRMTYHWPDTYELLSSGEKLSETGEGDVKTSRWEIATPVRFASFNLGIFYALTPPADTMPMVTVYRRQSETRSSAEQIAWDIQNSVRFFTTLFGPPIYTAFRASSFPAGHGEAYPGLIHLSSTTFEGNSERGTHETFRSHEVAHQWWGLGVEPASYHDWWLAEGFAEYSGLMYMHAVLKDQKRFFGTLDDYRDAILKIRSSIFGKGQEAGPIWLGSRTQTSTTEDDYWLIIYRKGAWVLHMLRSMMIDPNTLSDAKFVAMMKDFYQTYSGRRATTEDFQKIVEKHTGSRMDWFFQQWVYGTSVPTFRFAWTAAPTADGKYLLKCKVRQDNVPTTFRSYPLLRIEFGNDQISRGRRPVQGELTEFEIVVPVEPEDVTFNDLDSVLGEVKEVAWSDL